MIDEVIRKIREIRKMLFNNLWKDVIIVNTSNNIQQLCQKLI